MTKRNIEENLQNEAKRKKIDTSSSTKKSKVKLPFTFSQTSSAIDFFLSSSKDMIVKDRKITFSYKSLLQAQAGENPDVKNVHFFE